MATIVVEKEHARDRDEVKRALEAFEEDIRKFGLKPSWDGYTARIKGAGASGEIRISDDKVVVEVKLGLLAKAAGIEPAKVEASIRKRLDAALA